MKFVIRIFALSIVVVGLAAAATTPKTLPVISSHQSATANVAAPVCGPHLCEVELAGR